MEINDFVSGWKNKGDQEGDEFYKFFSYYIALNILYDVNANKSSSEKKRLESFVKKLISDNKFKNFKITFNDNSELIKQQITDMRTNRPSKIYKLEDVKNGNIVSIFLMIYQIRCNLFHGGKEVDSTRNKKLVKEVNVIMKLFLEKYQETQQ